MAYGTGFQVRLRNHRHHHTHRLVDRHDRSTAPSPHNESAKKYQSHRGRRHQNPDRTYEDSRDPTHWSSHHDPKHVLEGMACRQERGTVVLLDPDRIEVRGLPSANVLPFGKARHASKIFQHRTHRLHPASEPLHLCWLGCMQPCHLRLHYQ